MKQRVSINLTDIGCEDVSLTELVSVEEVFEHHEGLSKSSETIITR
jgi:hypothetical protein